MKKIGSVLLLLAMALSLAACGAKGPDKTGGEAPKEEASWFPEKATVTQADGTQFDLIVCRLEGDTLTARYSWPDGRDNGFDPYYDFSFTLKDGFVSRRTMESAYRADEVERVESEIAYDAAAGKILLQSTASDGSAVPGPESFAFTFDDQGRVASLTVHSKGYSGNEVDTLYTYAYGAESYTVSSDLENRGTGDGEISYREHTVWTIANDHSSMEEVTDIEPVTAALTIEVKEGGEYVEKEVARIRRVSNAQGYLTEETTTLADGTTGRDGRQGVGAGEFDADGRIVSFAYTKIDGTIGREAKYSYDENGNMSRFELTMDGETQMVAISWMKIPEGLARAGELFQGGSAFILSEMIEEGVTGISEDMGLFLLTRRSGLFPEK